MSIAASTRALVAAVVAYAAIATAVAGGAGRSTADSAGVLEDPVVGVVPQTTLDAAEIGLMREAGIESFRAWFAWHAVEPLRGTYDWTATDALVADASAQGVGVLPFLFGSSLWAAQLDGQDCADARCIPYAPASVETGTAFAEFAGEAARRYGAGGSFWDEHPELPYQPIRAWQVWNEQNSPYFHRPAVNVAAYAELLRLTAAEIRAADPGATIVLGGMWGPRSTDEGLVRTADYLRDLYAQPGAAENFDAVAVHPYARHVSGVVGQVGAARRVMEASGDAGAELWVTELGWASAGPARHNLVKGKRGQALMLRRALGRLLDGAPQWGLRAVYWYAWRDTPPGEAVCAWCPHAGLLTADGTEKPAWRSLLRLTGHR